MALTLEELLVRVGAETSGLNKLPGAVGAVMERVESRLNRATRGIRPPDAGWDKTVDRWRDSAGRFTKAADGSARSVRGLGGAMDGLAATGFSAVIAGLGVATLGAAVKMDSLKRGLASVATEADPVVAQLARLREVAKLPGLGFPEAIEGSTRLQAAGLSAELSEAALIGFGNALASVGAGKDDLAGVIRALSQIQGKGKVMAEEINQIAERLPQIRPLMQAAFGTSNTEALQKLGLSSEEFIGKLVAQLGNLARVTSGPQVALENIKDSIFVAAAAVGEGFLPVLEQLAAIIGPAVEKAAAAFTALPAPIRGALGGAVALLAVAGPLALVFTALSPTMVAAAAGIAVVGSAMGALVDAWGAVQDVLSGDESRVNRAVEKYGTSLFGLIDAFHEVRDVAADVWGHVQGVVSIVMDALGSIVQDGATLLLGYWEVFGGTIVDTFQLAWSIIKNTLVAAIEVIRGAFRVVTALATGDWAGAWDAIQRTVVEVSKRFTATFARAISFILERTKFLAGAIPGIGDDIVDSIQRIQDRLGNFADVLEWVPGQVNIPVVVTPEAAGPAFDPDDQTYTRTPPTTRTRRQPQTPEQQRAAKVLEILRDLPFQLAAAAAKGNLMGDALGAAEERARLLMNAAQGLVENGLSPADARVADIVRRYGEAATAAAGLKRQADISDALSDSQAELTRLAGLAATFGESMTLPEERANSLRNLIEQIADIDPADRHLPGLIAEWREAEGAAAAYARVLANMEASDAFDEAVLSSAQAYERATAIAERFYEATGDAAGYASARVQALTTQLDDLISQGADPTGADVTGTLGLLREAQAAESAATLVVAAYGQMKQAAVDFGVAALSAFGNALAGTDDLGSALMGAVGNLAGGLFDALGNVLIQTGITALGVGAGIAAIVQALTTLNPFVALAAGAALLALGAVVKSSLANAASGAGSVGGGARSGGSYAVGGTYGGSGRSGAYGERTNDSTRAVLEELRGLRGDVQGLANRPVQFTGDPREIRRATAAADANARRTDVTTLPTT